MTEAKNQQAEPSMEEILASIRRIISEDTEAGKNGPAPPQATSAVAPATAAPPPAKAPAADVLELTEMVGDDGKVMNLNDTDTTTRPAPEPAASPPSREDGNLLSKHAAAAAVSALSGLQSAARRDDSEPLRAGFGIGNGAATVEDIVRAELRPILKAWLDEHLPPLVERLVQKEIKRITRQIEEA